MITYEKKTEQFCWTFISLLRFRFSFHFVCFVGNYSETPVVEKEVVEVDAPKVVDEEETEVVENGNGEEAAAPAPAESAENGNSTEEKATEEVTSAEEVDVQNGDSTGKSTKLL